MKIALITSMKYGLTQFIFRDVKALIEKGHQVKLFTLIHAKGLYNPLPDWEVIPVSKWRFSLLHLRFLLTRPRLYLRLLVTALRTRSFVDLLVAIGFADHLRETDLIYAYFGDHKLFVGYYCKQITDIPLVVTIRAYELYRNPNPTMFKLALSHCDRVVTITEHNRNMLVEKFGVPPSKIDIVRQIIDLGSFKNTPKLKVLIVAFFAEKKGHEVLFKALKLLNRKDLELWVVGEGTNSVVQVDCRQLARDLDIESRVAFFGQQSGVALRALYRECDVFCLPSRPDRFGDHEGFPNVIAEAMAFGKPVISTRHAGIPEVVDSILVEENNPDHLAQALSLVCDSAALRSQLGQRNRARVEQLFSPANTDQLEQILQHSAGLKLTPHKSVHSGQPDRTEVSG